VDQTSPSLLRRLAILATHWAFRLDQLGAVMGDNGTQSGPQEEAGHIERGRRMAAMKPRTGDGPLEVTKEGRGIVMRVPLEGGGRLVVELNADEARDLGAQLTEVAG
jgi:hypothetical protein